MKYLPLLFLFAWSLLAQPANTFPRTANTAADLGVLPIPFPDQPPTHLTALLIGVNSVGDGQGGLFYWSYQSTNAGDGQNIFLSTNAVFATAGRWIRFPLVAPTPGQVTTPVFSPTDSSFTSPISVTISTTTPGASIYYTTDGSTPTSASTLYSGAIAVSADITFKAIGIKSGSSDSEIATKTYTLVSTVAAPVFTFVPPGPQTYLWSDDPGFPEQFTWSLATTTAGASIYWLGGVDTAFTPSIDPPSNLYVGPGSVGNSYQFKAIAYKDGIYSTVTTATKALELPVLWGYSSVTLPTGPQVRALSGAVYEGNPAPDGALRYVWTQTIPTFEYGIPAGSYDFDASSTVADYFYFAWPSTYPSPTAVNGFFLTPFPVSMAGPAEGYTDGPENGWYYKLIEVDTGTFYKVYRTFNPIGSGAAKSITVQ